MGPSDSRYCYAFFELRQRKKNDLTLSHNLGFLFHQKNSESN